MTFEKQTPGSRSHSLLKIPREIRPRGPGYITTSIPQVPFQQRPLFLIFRGLFLPPDELQGKEACGSRQHKPQ